MFGRNMRVALSVVCLFSAMSPIASAHEGHGTHGSPNSPTHYLTEPFHMLQFATLALAVLVLGLMVLTWIAKDRRLNQAPSQTNKTE